LLDGARQWITVPAAFTRRRAAGSVDHRQLPALTGVRFLLALWVVFHHLTGRHMMLESWAQSLPTSLHEIIRGGYLAVGTFFVLSGFVLARSYGPTAWNRKNLIRYGVGRFARVYPAYLLSLLIVSPYIFKFLFTPGRPSTAEKASVLASYVFVLQGWAERATVHWNTPAWSLSCEFFFYLCFPLFAFCLRKKRRITVATALVATVALPLLLARLGVPDYWKPLTHMADFLLGIGAAGVYDRVSRSGSWMARRGWWLYCPAVAGGAILVAFPDLVTGWTTLTAALRPMNVALVIGLGLGGGLPARLLSTRIASTLGNASYSLYILHVPLLWWFSRFWWRPTGLMLGVAVAAYLIGVVVVSTAVFKFVEGPANRRIREWVGARLR
jgi:peptidoglycan/LPS O-acetylase OafA/YrhL